jgi:hydrogenase-4 component F
MQVYNVAGQAEFVRPLFILLGLLSMGTAAVFMLGQKDYKRMLAYSSVEHMGILSLGLGLGGLATYGAFLHMINNAFGKGILFLTAGNIHRHYKSRLAIDVKGVFRRLPLSGGLFMLGFLAITGSPPFGVFISEFTILRSAVMNERWGIVAAFLFFLIVIFVGMGRLALSMTQGEAVKTADGYGPEDSFLTTVTPLVLAVVILALGLYIPVWLDHSLGSAALLIEGKPW